MSTLNGKSIKILIADEQPVAREGLAAILKKHGGMRVVGQVERLVSASEVCGAVAPDVVVFDFGTSLLDSVRAMVALLEMVPALKIIVFTASQNEETIYQAVQAGAHGYLLKSSSPEKIVECVSSVVRGERWFPEAISEALVRRMAAPELTPREREVLAAMAEGKSNREIGEALKVSEGTVKVHMTHILEKLRVEGRTGALAEAAARGLISLAARPPRNGHAEVQPETARIALADSPRSPAMPEN